MPRPLQLNETAPFAVKNGAQRIGERLTQARKRRRLTVRELASKAGISYDTARAVEAGNLQTGLGATLAMLWAMGLESEIEAFADPERDDLTPNPLTSLEKRDLAMTCGTFNRYANRINLLSQHGQFKLSLERATTIIDDVQQTVASRWHAVLRQHGTTPAECERLAAAFNYAGFELDPALVLAQQ